MRRLIITLLMMACFALSATADSLLFSGSDQGRFDITQALARDPYAPRINFPRQLTVHTLNPTTLDINNPIGSILYTYAQTNVGYFDLAQNSSTTLVFGQITRQITGTPGAASYDVPYVYQLTPLTLTLGPPFGDPASWVKGTLLVDNPTIPPFWGGNITATGITSGGGYVDPGDNINRIVGTLSYVFPQEVITLTFNPSTWVNNTLSISATVTRGNPAAEVPEPATLLLLGSGLAGLAIRKPRKSNFN